MSALWLSSSTLLVITLGFAGLLGELSFRLRERLSTPLAALAILAFGMVVLPPLSLPGMLPWLLWLSGFIVFIIYSLRPNQLPEQLLSRRFALRYIAIAMVFCVAWNLLTHAGFPALLMATFAGMTALMAWSDS